MIIGVQDIYYNVSDMKRSIAFYTQALQMKLQIETDESEILNERCPS
jgi:catechol 2,3-dioxygenase-like lactoylglutathione lyase family enzyme